MRSWNSWGVFGLAAHALSCRLSVLKVTHAGKMGSLQHVVANSITWCSQMAQWASDKRTPCYSNRIWIRFLPFNFHWLCIAELHLHWGDVVDVNKGRMKKPVSIFRLSEQKYFRVRWSFKFSLFLYHRFVQEKFMFCFLEETLREVNDPRPWH